MVLIAYLKIIEMNNIITFDIGWFTFVNDCGDRMGFFRLFGRGLAWKDLRYNPLLFSERNNYVNTFKIGHYSFKFLN